MRSMLIRASSSLAVFSLLALFAGSHAQAGGPPDSWSSAASMNVARQGHAVAMVGANVVVIGGCATMAVNGCQTGASTATYLNSAEQYTAGNKDSWSFIASMNSSRADHTATNLPNGKILVTGGIGFDPLNTTPTVLQSAEIYDPSTGMWTAISPMNSRRAGHTATLLPITSPLSFQVLLVGGITDLSGAISTTAEIYDSTSDTFTPTTDPVDARAYHTALPLTSGVLLARGKGTSGTVLDTIETFGLTPGSGFVRAGNMTTPRAFHAAAKVGNDVALFIGGRNDSGTDLATAETWDGNVASSAGSMGVGRESYTAT